jgi:hypothetical protein
MTRSIHATTASGDAVTLEAGAKPAARGRTLAQLEHNAMQALGLVRATITALQGVAAQIERAVLLLSHTRGVVDSSIRPELKRVFNEIGDRVRSAAHGGQLLLCGQTVAFALDDPWQESSGAVCIELPELWEAALGGSGLATLELQNARNALTVMQRLSALQSLVQESMKRFGVEHQRLGAVLGRLHRGRVRDATLTAARADEGFVDLIGRVRDHVLGSGTTALRVQGAPSTRAAWLVEACER